MPLTCDDPFPRAAHHVRQPSAQRWAEIVGLRLRTAMKKPGTPATDGHLRMGAQPDRVPLRVLAITAPTAKAQLLYRLGSNGHAPIVRQRISERPDPPTSQRIFRGSHLTTEDGERITDGGCHDED